MMLTNYADGRVHRAVTIYALGNDGQTEDTGDALFAVRDGFLLIQVRETDSDDSSRLDAYPLSRIVRLEGVTAVGVTAA